MNWHANLPLLQGLLGVVAAVVAFVRKRVNAKRHEELEQLVSKLCAVAHQVDSLNSQMLSLFLSRRSPDTQIVLR